MPILKRKASQPCGRILCQQIALICALVVCISGCVKPLGPASPTATFEPVIEVEEPTILETPRPTQTPKPTATHTPQPTRTPEPTAIPTITATPSCASGEIIEGSYASNIEGPTRSYRIYLPPCYQDSGRTYPSIYLLHGNLRGDEEFSELGLLDSAETLIAENQMPPAIVIMPDGRTVSDNTSGGDGSYEQVMIDELLPHIEQTYCVAADRDLRAIGGISRGGYWAFEIALRHPDKFSIVGGHSPAFFDSSEDPAINPILADIEDNGLRMRIDFGQEDPYRTRANILSRNMTSNGIPHAFIIYPNGGHDDAYWTAQLPAYLRWYSADWSQENDSAERCTINDSAE